MAVGKSPVKYAGKQNKNKVISQSFRLNIAGNVWSEKQEREEDNHVQWNALKASKHVRSEL